MKRYLIPSLVLLLATTLVKAQNHQDALRYSQLSLSGDARYVGLGGAFGALGGNFSALSTNPAAIGIYQRGDFSFTPSITRDYSSMLAQGEYSNFASESGLTDWNFDEKYQFNISNISLVGIMMDRSKSGSRGWQKVQFGLGMNRLADFNSRSYVEGDVYGNYKDGSYLPSSRLDDFCDDWFNYNKNNTGTPWLDDWTSSPLFGAYLLEAFYDSTSGGYNYLNILDYEGGEGVITQSKQTTTKGGISEMVFSLGGNYNDFFYLGGTLGVPVVRYRSTTIYSEENRYGDFQLWDDWSFKEDLRVNGSGVNFKIGGIIRPVDFLRIGLAYHTPTFYELDEEYSTSVSSNNYAGWFEEDSWSVAEVSYSIQTPSKLIGSLGFTLGKTALLSAEVEYIDYSKMRYRNSSDDRERAKNTEIANLYQATVNLKFGGELNLNPLRLRAGYQYNGCPYKDNSNIDWKNHTLSFGVGFKADDTYIDFAYARQIKQENQSMYGSYYFDDTVEAKNHKNLFIMTMGFRF